MSGTNGDIGDDEDDKGCRHETVTKQRTKKKKEWSLEEDKCGGYCQECVHCYRRDEGGLYMMNTSAGMPVV